MCRVRPPLSPTGLTIAIPFYRGREYLDRAVRSVFAQTMPDWRLIVCDDSADGEADVVVRTYTDDRVEYVRNPRNLGMAGNWNRCLDAAETDLVTLLHADDELLPDYARMVSTGAAAHPAAAGVFCRATVIGPDGTPVFSLPDRVKDCLVRWGSDGIRVAGQAGIASLLRGNYIMCPTVCYRKSLIGARRFQGRWKFVLDLDYFTSLLIAGEHLVGVPEYGYAYRRHSANATAAYTDNLLRFEEEAALYDELAEKGRVRGWRDVTRVARQKRIIRLHLAYRILADLLRGRVRVAADTIDFLCRLESKCSQHPQPSGCRNA